MEDAFGMKKMNPFLIMVILAGLLLFLFAFKYLLLRRVVINSRDGTELILIPAGNFIMGSPEGAGKEDEHPRRRVYLKSFYIGKYEVTNAQFAKFVNETGYEPRGKWKESYRPGTDNDAVACVTWFDAEAYCKWAGLRLPAEAEWEKAARGADGREYPWGNNWDATRCNCGTAIGGFSGGTKPVGSFPSGASPYGCLDMAGNVFEWCSDSNEKGISSDMPHSNQEGRGIGMNRILRGGSWAQGKTYFLRCAFRPGVDPSGWSPDVGFRVCRSAGLLW